MSALVIARRITLRLKKFVYDESGFKRDSKFESGGSEVIIFSTSGPTFTMSGSPFESSSYSMEHVIERCGGLSTSERMSLVTRICVTRSSLF